MGSPALEDLPEESDDKGAEPDEVEKADVKGEREAAVANACPKTLFCDDPPDDGDTNSVEPIERD
jgi:hypothetical protein